LDVEIGRRTSGRPADGKALVAVVNERALRRWHTIGNRRQEGNQIVQPGVVVDAELEIDADAFEEVVGQVDEADLERHLHVFKAEQVFMQIGNLLMHVLSLADDEAEVVFVTGDRARAADFGPALWGDGTGNQLRQAIEIGLNAASHAAGAQKSWVGTTVQS